MTITQEPPKMDYSDSKTIFWETFTAGKDTRSVCSLYIYSKCLIGHINIFKIPLLSCQT
jgi:hypothetical protein